MSEPTALRPWKQLEGEDDAAYLRFCYYRNYGPGRTLDLAYRASLAESDAVTTGNERANGTWRELSSKFNWVERAAAWDREMVKTHGHAAVVGMVAALKAATEGALRSIAKLDGPETWPQVLETLSALSSLIPPETIAAVIGGAPALPERDGPRPDQVSG